MGLPSFFSNGTSSGVTIVVQPRQENFGVFDLYCLHLTGGQVIRLGNDSLVTFHRPYSQ
jgi:hypothetical protein